MKASSIPMKASKAEVRAILPKGNEEQDNDDWAKFEVSTVATHLSNHTHTHPPISSSYRLFLPLNRPFFPVSLSQFTTPSFVENPVVLKQDIHPGRLLLPLENKNLPRHQNILDQTRQPRHIPRSIHSRNTMWGN